MKLKINDFEVTLPTTASEVTLKQRIDFQHQYGNELDRELKEIAEMQEGPERDIVLTAHSTDRMIKVFAFFAGVQPEAIKNSPFVDLVCTIYAVVLKPIFYGE